MQIDYTQQERLLGEERNQADGGEYQTAAQAYSACSWRCRGKQNTRRKHNKKNVFLKLNGGASRTGNNANASPPGGPPEGLQPGADMRPTGAPRPAEDLRLSLPHQVFAATNVEINAEFVFCGVLLHRVPAVASVKATAAGMAQQAAAGRAPLAAERPLTDVSALYDEAIEVT
ncbi:hypothetical protein Efla_005411 [Eimeria flavescens]